ncbi:MAG: RNA polymerase factor sigma-54 [Nitrospinaceae bacterium]
MGMEMKLNLKMTQRLVMTPMLQQAIKLLPLARLELANLVTQEIVENPVLEEILEDDTGPEAGENGDLSGEPANLPEPKDLSTEDPQEALVQESMTAQNDSAAEQEMDWDAFFQDSYESNHSSHLNEELPGIEATAKKDPTLHDHLHWQLNLTVDSDEDKFIGSCIIGNIQNDGYLTANLEEIAVISHASTQKIEKILKVIQGFDPTGVGARSLSECLLIQAHSLTPRDPLMETIIELHLQRLDERHFQKLANELKTPLEEVLGAIKAIKELDPKPGLMYQSEGIDYVVPDLMVVKTEKGYDVLLNDEGIPKVRVNSYYHNLLKSTSEEKTKAYLESKYRAAVWLIRSIDQRRQTIYKVGKSIVKLQKEFLDHGLNHIKPMVLRDVAQDIEMHESTVSRITTNKYIDTPQGIFELKFFFHSGIKTFMGGPNLSSLRVKTMIRDVVTGENQKKPYTDDELVGILMKMNAKIARRTVTKYRKELHIPAASKRKKIY